MKIYSSRRDDLIAERDAYDAETAELQSKADEADNRWSNDVNASEQALADEVLKAIGPTSLQLDVYARAGWDRGYEVTVKANDREKSNENRALAWDWEAKVGENGELRKESGSWSGLQATTAEQLNDLKESVRVLEVLQNIDWMSLLDKQPPMHKDYISREDMQALRTRKQERKNYEDLLLEEDLGDAKAQGKWVKLSGRPETDYYRPFKGEAYAKIWSMSPKFITVTIIRPDTIQRAQNGDEYAIQKITTDVDAEKMSKAKFLSVLVQPVEAVDINV